MTINILNGTNLPIEMTGAGYYYVAQGNFYGTTDTRFSINAADINFTFGGQSYTEGLATMFLSTNFNASVVIQTGAYIEGDEALISMTPGAGQTTSLVNAGTIMSRIGDPTGAAIEMDGVATLNNIGTIGRPLMPATSLTATIDFYTADSAYLINSGRIEGAVNGSTGNDVFDLRGGVVTGVVYGRLGDDTYFVDDASIQISEDGGGGYDTIYASSSYSLIGAFGIEALFLNGAGNLRGWGNGEDNDLHDTVGDNILAGRGGDDTLHTSEGIDVLRGGAGIDTVVIEAFAVGSAFGIVTLDLSKSGFQTVLDTSDTWEVKLVGIENATAQTKAELIGSNAANRLEGSYAYDTLEGKGGADTLIGGAGIDIILGGKGADIIEGGSGFDVMTGNGGNDVFLFLSLEDLDGSVATTKVSRGGTVSDVITDFEHNKDTIDLSAIDGIDGVPDSQFTWIDTAGFGLVAGELRYTKKTGIVQADLDGDGEADFEIHLLNTPKLTGGDFVL